jgi:hypothetical protein
VRFHRHSLRPGLRRGALRRAGHFRFCHNSMILQGCLSLNLSLDWLDSAALICILSVRLLECFGVGASRSGEVSVREVRKEERLITTPFS